MHAPGVKSLAHLHLYYNRSTGLMHCHPLSKMGRGEYQSFYGDMLIRLSKRMEVRHCLDQMEEVLTQVEVVEEADAVALEVAVVGVEIEVVEEEETCLQEEAVTEIIERGTVILRMILDVRMTTGDTMEMEVVVMIGEKIIMGMDTILKITIAGIIERMTVADIDMETQT